MNIAQLETLVGLSRLRNFRKMAQQMGTAQPAIPMRIKQLERELGIASFHKDATRTSLTDNARQLLECAVGITYLTCQLIEKAEEKPC